jgi:hypothetical protein
MNMRQCFLLTTAMVSFAATCAATEPQATGYFVQTDHETKQDRVIDSASLDEEDICFVVKGNFTADGDHSYQLTIYDGNGREVLQMRGTVTADGGRWGRRSCYGMNEDRDVAGTWWYVAELDGELLVSESLAVTAP